MKHFILLFTAFITFSSCKKEKEFENAFVGYWKFVSVTDNSTGATQTKPGTLGNVVTTFYPNSNHVFAQFGGLSGGGNYRLTGKTAIKINIMRGDKLPAPDGPWFGLYLEVMNQAASYRLEADNTHLFITTSDNRVIFFTKL